jgi:hypothetical protein
MLWRKDGAALSLCDPCIEQWVTTEVGSSGPTRAALEAKPETKP